MDWTIFTFNCYQSKELSLFVFKRQGHEQKQRHAPWIGLPSTISKERNFLLRRQKGTIQLQLQKHFHGYTLLKLASTQKVHTEVINFSNWSQF